MVWYSHPFQNFPVCCDPHSRRLCHSEESRNRCFSGTLLLFRWSSGCWQFDLWFSAFCKTSLNIWKFTVLAWKSLSITLLACEMSAICGSLSILWHCPSLELEWKLTFSSPVATAEFSKCAGILSAALSQHRVTTTTKQTKSKMTSVAEDVHKLEHVHRWWDCIVKWDKPLQKIV